jgi:hypothetical protein
VENPVKVVQHERHAYDVGLQRHSVLLEKPKLLVVRVAPHARVQHLGWREVRVGTKYALDLSRNGVGRVVAVVDDRVAEDHHTKALLWRFHGLPRSP